MFSLVSVRVLVTRVVIAEGLGAVREVAARPPPPRPQRLEAGHVGSGPARTYVAAQMPSNPGLSVFAPRSADQSVSRLILEAEREMLRSVCNLVALAISDVGKVHTPVHEPSFSYWTRVAALGLFAAVCGAGGAVAAVTGVPQLRDALRGPVGPQGSIGRNGPPGPPGQDAVSVDPAKLKRDVISDLNQSSCLELGTQVSVVTSAAVSPFDTFGRPSLDLTKQTICVLK